MTGTHPTITDELLRRALAGLAGGADADHLVEDVLTAVDVAPQARTRWLDFGHRRTALLLIAAILLLVALAGALTLGSKPKPLPQAVEQTISFMPPFEYVRPAGVDLQTTESLSGLGVNRAYALEMMRRLYGPCPGGCSVGTLDPPVPLASAEVVEYTRHLDEWNAELSALMTSFTVGGPEGDRGVIVALPAGAPFGFSVWCFGPVSGTSTSPTSQEILDSYGSEPWGQILPAPENGTFDGRTAVSVRSPAGRCPTSHPSERQAVVPQPGVITLVQINADVVAVVIWGETDAVLDAWLPTATEFVKTIHFITEETT